MNRLLRIAPFTLLGFAAVLCAAAVITYGFWYRTIVTESTTVASLGSQIDTQTAAAARIASARAALAQIAGDEAAVQAYFVPQTNVVPFIDDLQTRGQSLGTVIAVQSVSANAQATHPSLSLELTVSGSFDAVLRTLGAIEYAPYDLSITGLSLVQGGPKAWHADVKMLVGSAPSTASLITSASSTPSVPASAVPAATTTGTLHAAVVAPKPKTP
jgi:hypothetical protein